ncbi:isatin hydrolase-like [Clytia hemisphaerica]|uniref:Uncharacterized protein n=1 Tax=Clytia hemisphaerica TaxID=252671 RepID=A0A7M5V0C6_9CNID
MDSIVFFLIMVISVSPITSKLQFVDLTYNLDNVTTPYFGLFVDHFKFLKKVEFKQPEDFYISWNVFSTNEHMGTHIDAPVHFVKGSQTVDEIPLQRLVGKLFILDVEEETLKDRFLYITTQHILDAEKKQGKIEDGSILLVNTGLSKFVSNLTKYFGGDPKDISSYQHPGLTKEAAQWLVDNRNIASFGIDTPSLDHAKTTNFPVHRIFLGQKIPGYENVDLSKIDQFRNKTNVLIIAMPMKIRDGTGAPTRMVAMYDDSVTSSAQSSFVAMLYTTLVLPIVTMTSLMLQ